MKKYLPRLVLVFTLALGILGYAMPAYADDAAIDEDAADTVEFVYIDQTSISVGDTQYVAVGLVDEDAQISSAMLTLVSEGEGEDLVLEATAISDNAVLFEAPFADDADPASYVLDSMVYLLEGSDIPHEVDLASSDNPYGFEVVSAQTAELLDADDSDSCSDDGITVVTLGENGEVQASSSLAGGLDAALASIGLATLATTSTDSSDGLVVCINAGHGGSDSGAVNTLWGLKEKDLTLKIAQYMRDELSQYQGVTVVMTRETDKRFSENAGEDLQARVDIAAAAGADVYISIHINSTGTGLASGAEVWVPNDSSYNYSTHVTGTALGQKILDKLAALGLTRRSVNTRDYPAGEESSQYADGSVADYYGDIRRSRKAGITGLIVEHAFIDNSSDAAFLSQEANLQALGVADATAVAEYYGLSKYTPQEEIAAPDGGTTVYRVYNPNSGLRHLTTSLEEVRYLQSLGWRSEGLSFFAGTQSHDADTPVYRVYNPNDGNHHFTASKEEYEYLVSIGWNDEGIAWYACSDATNDVYRLYNPNNGEHHYTTSEYEYEYVTAAGWDAEGVAWKSL